MSSPQPQIKQQPHTPVHSPLPPPLQQQQQQLQQHSHADLLTTSHGSAQSTDSSSLNLVSALTAAIHANSKTGTSSGAGGGGGGSASGLIRSETAKAGSGHQQQMRNESLNEPTNSSVIDPHLHETGLSEPGTNDIAQMKFRGELQSKFPGNYLGRIFVLKSDKVSKHLAKFHFIFY